uniref:Kelch-like protein diablo n=1 Tax=Glossina brevipalpis TaxID=37001 RepID=A0A1A9WZ32_9MUSC
MYKFQNVYIYIPFVDLSDRMAAKNIDKVKPIAEKEYKNSDYSNTFLDRLNKMRINKKRCDFSLEVEGEIFRVHKLALEIASPYFAAMFDSDMKEVKEGVVRLVDTDLIAVKLLVEYIYTGIITLTEDNVETLLFTSDLFQIEWVKKQCEEFLKGCIDFKKCFRIWNIADTLSCKALYDFAYKYILNNFDHLFDNEELLMLPFEKLSRLETILENPVKYQIGKHRCRAKDYRYGYKIQELIKDNQLSIESEDNVYKTVLNWIKYDLEKRQIHLADLMSHIRLPLLSNQFLKNDVAAESLLRENPKCHQFLIDAFTCQSIPVNERKCSSDKFRIKRNKEYRNEQFHVFLIGGIDTGLFPLHNRCKVYDVSKKNLLSIPNMNEHRYGPSAIALNGNVYSVGGYCSFPSKTAERYVPFIKRWNYIAPMKEPRYDFGICAHNDLIYAVGGFRTATVENYDPINNAWYPCPNIPIYDPTGVSAVVVGNSIYSYAKSTWFRLDPRESSWYKLNEMNDLSFDGLVSNDCTLFCIGHNGKFLDVRMNRWGSMSPMPYRAYGFSSVINANDIWVFGGKETDQIQNHVEHYSIDNDEWSTFDLIGIELIYNAGAAVISGCFDFN